MKKLYSFMLGAFLALGLLFSNNDEATADSPRMVVVENFTSATCPPCATVNPAFIQFAKQNLDKMIVIKNHVWWPAAGDPMYNNNQAMAQARVSYYHSGGASAPAFFVNGGLQNGPGYFTGNINTAGQAEILRRFGTTSPLTINLTETRTGGRIKTNLTVNSTRAYSNASLRVVVMEDPILYPTPPGSNGEKDFHYVSRQILPSNAGEPFTIAANQTLTFEFEDALVPNLTNKNVYVVAYIQDNSTKEILQGSRTESKATIETIATVVGNRYLRVDGNGSVTQKVRFTNPGSQTIDVEFRAVNEATFYDGWEVSFSKASDRIVAGQSVEIDVTITPNGSAGMQPVNVIADPIITDPNFVGDATPATLFALSNESKYAFVYGLNGNGVAPVIEAWNSAFVASKTAFIPFNKEILDNYPMKDFEIAFLPSAATDLNASNYLATDPDNFIYKQITDALDAGKKVFLNWNLVNFYAYGIPMDGNFLPKQAGVNFLTNRLGLKIAGSTQQTNLMFFVANNQLFVGNGNGIQEDVLGRGMSFGYNNWSPINFYNQFVDVLSIGDATKAIAFLRGTTNLNSTQQPANNGIIGTRHEFANGARLVYMTTTFDAMSNFGERGRTMRQILEYLLPPVTEPEPRAELTPKAIVFGEVQIGQSVTREATIKNIGEAALNITEFFFDFDTPEFELVTPASSALPINIAPGQSITISVKFTPTTTDALEERLNFDSNDPLSAENYFELSGVGTEGAPKESGIALSRDAVTFPTTGVGVTTQEVIEIENTGEGLLVVSTIDLTGNGAAAFSVVNPPANAIEPGEKYQLNVYFTPTSGADFVATMTINSNAANEKQSTVALNGKGDATSVRDFAGIEGVLTLKAGPNPFVANTTITYEVGGNTQTDLTLEVIDATGARVAELFSGKINPGQYTAEFGKLELANGTYYVIGTTNGVNAKLPITHVK